MTPKDKPNLDLLKMACGRKDFVIIEHEVKMNQDYYDGKSEHNIP